MYLFNVYVFIADKIFKITGILKSSVFYLDTTNHSFELSKNIVGECKKQNGVMCECTVSRIDVITREERTTPTDFTYVLFLFLSHLRSSTRELKIEIITNSHYISCESSICLIIYYYIRLLGCACVVFVRVVVCVNFTRSSNDDAIPELRI